MKNRNSLILIALLITNLICIFAFYQTKQSFTINVGSRDDYWYIDGFYDRERSSLGQYRWTRDWATAILPMVGSPYEIKVLSASFRPEGTPLPQFTLKWDSPALSQTATSTPLLVEQVLKGGSSPTFQFEKGILSIFPSDTFQPSTNDARTLGVLVQKISIQAYPNKLGFIVPPLGSWFVLAFGLWLVQSWLVLAARIKLPWLLRRAKLFWFCLFLTPLLLLALFLSVPLLALETGFSIGMGLLAMGVTGHLLLRFEEKGLIWAGIILALVTGGVLYGLYSFVAPLLVVIGIFGLGILYNPRFNHIRFNLLLIGAVAVLACWGLLQQRAIHTHDGEFSHYYWLNELDLLIKGGNFYPRWASDFSFGHGSTIFNFYAPLSRYLAEVFVLLQLPPAFAFQAFLCVATVASGVSLYFLARRFTGELGALVAAAAYIYHPFRLADIYMRGAMAEVLNFVFIPLVLLAVLQLLPARNKKPLHITLVGSLGLALLLVSHQLTAFYFIIFLLIPTLLISLGGYFWREWRGKAGKLSLAVKQLAIRTCWLGFMGLLGLGLAAFYILPVVLESKYVNLSSTVVLEPKLGFLDGNNSNWKELVPVLQVSASDAQNTNNLAWIGATQLILAVTGLLMVLLPTFKFTRFQRWQVISIGLLLVLLLFMQTPVTEPFWSNVPGMVFIQFTWRLMMFVALLVAILLGYFAEALIKLVGNLVALFNKKADDNKRQWVGIVVVSLLCLILGYSGAGRVELTYNASAYKGEYSEKLLTAQIEHGDTFYLPKWAGELVAIAKDPAKYQDAYLVRNNQRQPEPVTFTKLGSNRYQITLEPQEASSLVLPIFYFTGWTLTANGQEIPITYNSPTGFITGQVGAGRQTLYLTLENSPVQNLGNYLSFVTLVIILILFWWSKRKAQNK